jgi:hypothetical protein
MTNTNATTIMLVDLSVEESMIADFNRFYHDVYIPGFLEKVPEITSARRYAQTEGFLDGDRSRGHFLTVYEMDSDQSTDKIDAAINSAALKKNMDAFNLWKEEGLTHFDRAFYKLVCRHGRMPKTDPWDKHAIYTLRWIEKADAPLSGEQFHWVEYFNREMFRVPKWLTCRTYMRMHSTPPSYLTVFEATDQDAILEALDSLADDLEEEDQIAFAGWLQSGVDWHDCLMLKPIYLLAK